MLYFYVCDVDLFINKSKVRYLIPRTHIPDNHSQGRIRKCMTYQREAYDVDP